MRTYTFYYYDSYESYLNLDYKKFVISGSTFSIASSRFLSYLRSLDCDYLAYGSTYSVISRSGKESFRSFKELDLITLACIKDEHNAAFWSSQHD